MKASDLVNMLGAMDGAEIPGGCDECNAYQKVRAVTAGVWSIDIFHDDTCPTYLAMQRRRDR